MRVLNTLHLSPAKDILSDSLSFYPSEVVVFVVILSLKWQTFRLVIWYLTIQSDVMVLAILRLVNDACFLGNVEECT